MLSPTPPSQSERSQFSQTTNKKIGQFTIDNQYKSSSYKTDSPIGENSYESGVSRRLVSTRRSKKVHPKATPAGTDKSPNNMSVAYTKNPKLRFPNLKVDTNSNTESGNVITSSPTPMTSSSGSSDQYSFSNTPSNNNSGKLRGSSDIRSPGEKATPVNTKDMIAVAKMNDPGADDMVPIPDFITQTDQYGNATTPRNPFPNQMPMKSNALMTTNSMDNNNDKDSGYPNPDHHDHEHTDDPCEALLESFRMMCCCLLSDDKSDLPTTKKAERKIKRSGSKTRQRQSNLSASRREKKICMLLPMDPDDPNRLKLLPRIHPNDKGKKCLVLDLDETLVHSSFRAVPGADFVIPVQIEDVVHFVYVAKRPGVDAFLVEMAKYYEIVVYTASLNKYADPLLDLLDPHRVIRTRLFRESCVYFEGNYVKDLSLIDRDLSQAIIVDNSPNSYLFHPDNAIDCSSFIDDPSDKELMQIGGFLKSIKDVEDVRGICCQWKNWPDIDLKSIQRITDQNKREQGKDDR